MKNCKSIVIICVLAMVGTVGLASAQGVLVNPDFEAGLTGWEALGGNAVATVTIDSPDNGPTLPGSNHAFMENYGEAVGLTLKQTTPVGSAQQGEVTYSYDLKLDQADIGGVLFVEIFAEQEGVGIIGGSGLKGPYWPWNVWTTYTGSFNAPAGTDFLTVQIMANTGASVGSNCVAHVDNVIIEGQGVVGTESASWSNVKALYR